MTESPKEVFIDFTNICNYKCIFCTNRFVKERHILRLKDIKNLKEIIDKAELVDITGWGEVTTHPEFKEIILFLTNLNKQFTITTNGSLLNNELIGLLRNSPMKHINISLNSLNRETYKKLSGGFDNLNKVLINIDLLAQEPRNYEVYVSFVMNNYNLNEVENIRKFGKEKDVNITLFDLTPTIKNYEKELKIEDTPKNRKRLSSNFFDNRNINKKASIMKGCRWVYDKIFIRWDGVVTPCCWCLEEMGDITKQNWKDVWDGKKYKDLRNCIKTGNLKYCKDCRRLG